VERLASAPSVVLGSAGWIHRDGQLVLISHRQVVRSRRPMTLCAHPFFFAEQPVNLWLRAASADKARRLTRELRAVTHSDCGSVASGTGLKRHCV